MGAELKTSGSPVRVGKMDATAYSGQCERLNDACDDIGNIGSINIYIYFLTFI